jgi:hypothetical protein
MQQHPDRIAQRRAENAARAAALEAMPPAERDLRLAVWRWRWGGPGYAPPAGELTRRICVTTCPGAYGHACIVVAIEGSPPRGLFAVTDPGCAADALVNILDGRRRRPIDRWASGQRAELRRAILAYLREKGGGSCTGTRVKLVAKRLSRIGAIGNTVAEPVRIGQTTLMRDRDCKTSS